MHIWQYRHLLLHTVRILSVALLICIAIFLKASYFSRIETSRGNDAYQRQEFKEAIVHYERAIKWYTPFSRSVKHSVERLWEIGTTAENHKDLPLALDAYWALRASLYAVQSFYRPYQQWIIKTERRIAPVMATMAQSQKQQLKAYALEKDRERFTAMLQRKTTVDQGGVILTEIGFLGWIGATIGFIWYALGNDQMWIWKRCLLWGSTIVIFFTAWIVGMLIA